jgi:peptidoglycan/LPS O-acetylase OafA/YrhL
MTEAEQAPRYPLTAVRALAAVPVLIFHAYQHSRYGPVARWPLDGTIWHTVLLGSDFCVDLFFVLSAFLLGLPYARALLGTARARSGRMVLLRRVARLMPAYLIVVGLVWGLSNPRLPGDWQDLVLHVTFTHIYNDKKIFYTDGPAWSLAVEMHFYLMLVVLGWLGQRWLSGVTSRRVRLAAMYGTVLLLILLGVGYKLWALYVVHARQTQWSYWFNPASRLDVFAIGLGFAVVMAAGWRPRRISRYAIGVLGGAVVVVGTLTQPVEKVLSTWWHPLVALGIALVLAAAIAGPGRPLRILTWRPLVWMGTVSYSLYLWQEPVLRLIDSAGLLPPPGRPETFPITAVLLFGGGLLVAWWSYALIERTGLQLLAAFDRAGRRRDYYAEGPAPLAPAGGSDGVPVRSARTSSGEVTRAPIAPDSAAVAT